MVVDCGIDTDGVYSYVDEPAVLDIEHLVSEIAVVEGCTNTRIVVFALLCVLQDNMISC